MIQASKKFFWSSVFIATSLVSGLKASEVMGIDLRAGVEPLIREAGKIVLSYFSKIATLERYEKGDDDFATEADIASETFLIEGLSNVLPGAAFVAEESGISGNSDYRWVIDPLDGTTNFAHGIPYFCISVGLAYKDEMLFGMIYQPVQDELFWAQKGKGAWLNGKKIQVSSIKNFDEALIVVALPFRAHKEYAENLAKTRLIGPKIYGLRQFGAAALDLAYVACGRLDGMFYFQMKWWDFAAGNLLVREAGGHTVGLNGGQIGPNMPTGVIGNAVVCESLQEILH